MSSGKTNKNHFCERNQKEVDGRKIKYYYDGSLLLAEKDGNGNILKIYINDGEGIVGMVRYIYNASGIFSHYQRLYYLYDSLGSVSVITNELGLPVQQYTYSPYGSTMNVDYDPINKLRFVGRYGGYRDDDTGLTYFWHRWYDEGDGRWVSRDMEDSCDFEYDAYSYTKNSPLNYLDTNGLWRYKKDKSVEPTSAETEKMIDCLQAKLECGLIVTGGGEKGKPHKGLGHREGRAVDFGTNSNPCLKYKDVNKVCQAAIECGFNFTDFENQGTPNEHYHFEKRSGPVNNKCKDKHKKDSCDIKPNLPTLGDL